MTYHTASYADDTKLYNSTTSSDDCKCIQRSLTNLNKWNENNSLNFNASKCKVLTITRKISPIMYEYTLGVEKLIRIDSEKDVGVIT